MIEAFSVVVGILYDISVGILPEGEVSAVWEEEPIPRRSLSIFSLFLLPILIIVGSQHGFLKLIVIFFRDHGGVRIEIWAIIPLVVALPVIDG